MKRKRQIWRSILCVLAAALLLTASPLTALEAHAVTQAEIDSLKEQLKELEAQAQAQQEVINSLTDNKARVVDRKIALDAKIDLTRRQIQLIQSQVEIYDQIVAEKQGELEQAQAAEETQAELLRTRMRAMEENGNSSYISFLFDSSSLTELLSRLADVDDIMHYDQTLEAEYKAAREDVEVIKKSYEETLSEQEALSKELDRKTEELDAQITAAYTLIADLNVQSDNAQAEFDAIDKARAEADAEIDALLKKLAEEEAARKAAEEAARQAAAAAGGGSGTTTTPSSAVSLTFFTVLFYLAPAIGSFTKLIREENLFMHFLTPLMALASFCIWERRGMGPWVFLWGMLPILLYGSLYLRKVVFDKTDKAWDDLYGFNRKGRWPLSLCAMLSANMTICLCLSVVQNMG